MPNLPIADQNRKTSDTKVNDFASGYYSNNYPITGAEYDAVKTFFLAKTGGNISAAESLTSSVLTIAANRNINPIGIVEDFKKYNNNSSFTAALIGLINSDRRNTSKLGYGATPNPDTYVTRNIGS